MESEKPNTYEKIIRYYPRSMGMLLVFSILLLLLSLVFIKVMGPAPTSLILFTTYYLYAHIVCFGFGIVLLLQWLLSPSLRQTGIRVRGVLLGTILSPVSAVVAYAAVFLFAVSSCSG